MKVYRKDNSAQGGRIEIFNIMEATYTGKDMGERSITATIDFPSRIDFQPGDYVEFDIANLLRMNGVEGGHEKEKFYIYTMPTVKKIAKSKTSGKAFQHTVTFYPCQYELATVKMRDVVQDTDNSGVLYTGYDEFSFYGGANTLMKRIMAVLNERFGHTGVAGKDHWAYKIADGVNEDLNTALEQFQFDFSDNNVMEALLKLNDAEGVNTKFFINERMIYVGYKRPYITGVDEYNIQRTVPFEFMYGKTSHLPAHTNYGNLFTITKSNGSASPITRLFAKGSDRNLHRFYCSDRIKRGRYVNRLMLPSFSNDGHTDYIDSQEGIARFGIREGSKTFDKIYPSLRFFYYGDLRDVKYCIKIMGSGLESDADDVYDTGTLVSKSSLDAEQLEKLQASYDYAKEQIEEHSADPSTFSFSITMNGEAITMSYAQTGVLLGSGSVRIRKTSTETQNLYHYPIARIQCYRVEELLDSQNNPTGINHLVESAPPVDLAVFCHATGKVVKCVLYAAKDGQSSTDRQLAADGKIPTHTEGGTDYIVGSCFAVHDDDFGCGHTHGKYTNGSYDESGSPLTRADWFINPDTIETTTDDIRDPNKEKYKNEIELHQINYTDDHWITDIYEFTDYDQDVFNRQGYSAYCWPRVNRSYPESKADNIEVNAVVDVGPVYIEDTDLNISQGQQQQTFDLYLRDVGFKINEQTWFGDRVFLFDTCKISFLDGNLAGYEFEMPNESDQEKLGSIYVPALTETGERNPEFFDMADNPAQAEEAFAKGAFWRLVVKRADIGIDRYWMPNTMVNASAGNHIVFLDIFMPDIYVRVAENRLLKEAQKYLDANDDGDIQYSFDMDQVRPNEQPIFALQMREGAIMRVVDDDLDVGTINEQKTLFDDKNGLVSMESMQKYDVSVETDYEVVERTREDLESTQGTHIAYDETNHEYYLFFDTLLGDANKDMYYADGLTIYWVGSGISFKTKANNILGIEHTGSGTTATQHKLRLKNIDFLKGYEYAVEHWDWKVQYCFEQTILTPQIDQAILPIGVRRYCAANNLTEFEAGKYYEVVIDTMEDSLAVHDGAVPRFALVNGLGDGQTIYNPEYTAENMTPSGSSYKRYKYKFTLPDEFNDNEDYYPAILYASDGQTRVVHVRLMSIIEQDGERLGDINYVDLGIDTVTINFHDNTRETGVSLQNGTEPERLIEHDTEMIYKITATVKEESRATAWAQLMERVEDAEVVEEQNNALYKSIVEAARKHHVELMNLRNNIFDPDGTCKDTFLQIMMLQVGADSMNYQLRYTHYSITGQRTNCGIRQTTPSVPGGDKFYIGNADERLDHFVFTDAPTYGTWYPDKNLEFLLTKETGATEWPTYFVSLKCSATSSDDCHWKCETIQRKVNEESGYYYFNWGILVPDAFGHYTLTETRGNAYMYGDNLIVGKISTLARNSYFDLTHGNFVLAHGNSTALSYINGVLTISGLDDTAGIGKTIKDLGLDVEALENAEIGGENLLYVNNFSKDDYYVQDPGYTFYHELTYYSTDTTPSTHTFLPAGKYVFSAKGLDYGTQDQDFDMEVSIAAINSSGNIHKSVVLETGDSRDILLETTVSCYFALVVEVTTEEEQVDTNASVSINDMMLQSGVKSTAYQAYVKHLTDAIKGTTQIAGGLMMTNLLILKDENGNVVAGMSGLTDDSTEQGEESEGVTLWSGGSYKDALDQAKGLVTQLSDLLPILLTKTGIGSRIGCFYVKDNHTVVVNSQYGRIEIDASTNGGGGIRMFDQNNKERISLIPQSINNFLPPDKESVTYDNSEDHSGGDNVGTSWEYYSTSALDELDIPTGDNEISFYFNFAVIAYFSYGGTATGTVRIKIDLDVKTGTNWSVYETLVNVTNSVTIPTGGTANCSLSTPQSAYKRTLSKNKYRIHVKITEESGSNDHIVLYSWDHYATGWVYPAYDPRTIIGTDGMICAFNGARSFAVVNQSNKQIVKITGLPKTDPGTEGQLYADSFDHILRVSAGS